MLTNSAVVNGTEQKATMMLVDDDPFFLRLAQEFVHTYYHNVYDVVATARNGEEGLTKAQKLAPDIVLIDLNMPGIGGLRAISLMRIIFPETCIIALTLNDSADMRQAVLSVGGSDLVSKAHMHTHLVPAIERARQGSVMTSAPQFMASPVPLHSL